jgi:hypothetical protein
MSASAAAAPADRSANFDLFKAAGFVSTIEDLDRLPQGEYDELLGVLNDNSVMQPDFAGDVPEMQLNEQGIPELTVEERIQALKPPKGGLNIQDEMEQGRRMARDLLELHHVMMHDAIMQSKLAGMDP